MQGVVAPEPSATLWRTHIDAERAGERRRAAQGHLAPDGGHPPRPDESLETHQKKGIPQDVLDGAEDPLLPISNTEVKLCRAEDTWLETTWENR